MQIPKHVSAGQLIISPTRVEGGIKCLRKHTLDDILSYRLPGADPIPQEFGKRMHAACALWWSDHDISICQEYLMAQVWPLNEKHTLALAMQLIGLYSVEAKLMPFQAPGDEWKLVALEERVLLQVGSVTLSFQLDRLVEEQRMNLLAMIDIKSAARTDARWAKQWPRSLQMKLYSEAIWRKYGRELDWLVVEGLQKGPAKLALEVVPPFSQAMRDEAMRNFTWVARHDYQLLEACKLEDGSIDIDKLFERALSDTPHNPAECFSYGGSCQYLPLCEAEPSERLALLKEGYVYHEPEYV